MLMKLIQIIIFAEIVLLTVKHVMMQKHAPLAFLDIIQFPTVSILFVYCRVIAVMATTQILLHLHVKPVFQTVIIAQQLQIAMDAI